MSNDRHSWIRFFPSDWMAGTAGMSAAQRNVYFEICCRIWDKAQAVPKSELPIILGFIERWRAALNQLVAAGKLVRHDDGSVSNARAMKEATISMEAWAAQSAAGKRGANKRWKGETSTSPGDPDGDANGSDMTPLMENQNQNQNYINREPAGRNDDVGFDGQIIKLSPSEIDAFRQMYPNLDLLAELRRSDDFYALPDSGANWLPRLKGWLTWRSDQQKPQTHASGLMPYRPGVDL